MPGCVLVLRDLLTNVKSKIEVNRYFIRRRKKGTRNQATAIENFWRWPWMRGSEAGC